MRSFVRQHVAPITALLSGASLFVVFGVVGGLVPTALVPRSPDWLIRTIPHVNAGLSALALAAIVTGVRAIRRGNVATHRRRMSVATLLFVAFLALYLYRIALEGPTTFDGPAALEPMYFLVLGVHVTLAIVCLPLVYYVLVLAYSYDVSELSETNHPRVGRIAAPLWAVSFAGGIVVYLTLYVVFPG